MLVSMTTVKGAGDVEEPARMAAEAMRSWLREFDGYCGTLVLVDDAGAEQRSRPARSRMREQMVAAAGVELEGNEVFSVAFVDELQLAP